MSLDIYVAPDLDDEEQDVYKALDLDDEEQDYLEDEEEVQERMEDDDS